MYALHSSKSERVESFIGEYLISSKGTLTPEEAARNTPLERRIYAREVITFTAKHELIHRGINRFLPREYVNSDGKKGALSFELEEVFSRDGVIEGARLERNFIRMYSPESTALLPIGANSTGVSYFIIPEGSLLPDKGFEAITFDIIPPVLAEHRDISLKFAFPSPGKGTLEVINESNEVVSQIHLTINENVGFGRVSRLNKGERLKATLQW